MPAIVPFLWFNNNAEEAVAFYTAIFPDSGLVGFSRYPDPSPNDQPPGSAMVGEFRLMGQRFIALNGGPMFTFSPAISMYVECGSQAEIDKYWEALGEGGEYLACGWLKDRYGVCWQIAPDFLADFLSDANHPALIPVQRELWAMQRLDYDRLKAVRDAAMD